MVDVAVQVVDITNLSLDSASSSLKAGIWVREDWKQVLSALG